MLHQIRKRLSHGEKNTQREQRGLCMNFFPTAKADLMVFGEQNRTQGSRHCLKETEILAFRPWSVKTIRLDQPSKRAIVHSTFISDVFHGTHIILKESNSVA